jgi:NAD(P)-dependent dehydrogenase (short-subunit alcohol dehydrogenase family)
MKKNILVVGATSGIGLSLSKILLADTHHVIGTGRREKHENPAVEYHAFDVMTDALPAISVPLHGIAYCAGSINLKPFKALKIEDFRRDFEINVTGALRILQHYEKNMREAEASSVVLFSTVAVQTGMSFHASVAAAKGAVEGLTRALAAEFAPKIRVNAVAPSLTDTPLAERLLKTEAQRKASEERHPLKRIGNPDNVAELAAFLLSDKSSWITGQIIQCDGGLSSVRSV